MKKEKIINIKLPTEKFFVKLDWETCEILAHYYRFPTCVFLLTKENIIKEMKGKIRKRIKR